MATTTNFGWETPDDTDLVKDGAAAIRTALGGVDTSFVDLKGGTTGQILSKASDTDLDYSWVTTDDANAIQNAIVDAKGDLIAASAADTPARLAVGTDYAFLQADSAQSTGLNWENAAWVSYTPTVTAASGSFTTISATGRYKRVGKICVVTNLLTITTVGTGTGPRLSLPFTVSASSAGSIGSVRERAVTGRTGVISTINSTTAQLFRYDDGAFVGDGYTYVCSLTFEVA